MTLGLVAALCAIIAFDHWRARTGSEAGVREPGLRTESEALEARRVGAVKWPRYHRAEQIAAAEDTTAFELAREIQTSLSAADAEKVDQLCTELLPQLVSRNALLAGRVVESIENPEIREEMLHRLVRLWAAQDAPSVLAWANQLPQRAERDAALSDACLQVAQASPRDAVRIAEQFGLAENPVIESVAQQWASKEFPAALEWTRALSAGSEREKILARLAYVQSERDPQSAARLVVQEIPPGPVQNEAAISVLHQWALRDFTSAAQWTDRFPAGELRDRAQNELAGIAIYGLAKQPE